jgi:hypothetical protein
MADRYAWRAGSTALNLASSWIDLTTGANPATVAPDNACVTIDVAGVVQATGSLCMNLLTLEADLDLAGLIFGAGVNLLGGTIDLSAGGTLSLGGAPKVAGSIEIASGATLYGHGRIDAPSVVNGLLRASGGALDVFAPISGGGKLSISAGATLFTAGAVGAGLTVAFNPGAVLQLFTDTAGFAAGLSNFAPGDVIDISASPITAAQWSAGTLTLSGADGSTMALALPGAYATTCFLALPDSWGGSAICMASTTLSLPAAAGTLSLGTTGVVALAAGTGSADTVLTAGTVALGGSLVAGSLTAPALFAVVAGGTLTAGTLIISGTLAALDGGMAGAETLLLTGGTISADALSAITLGAGAEPIAGSVALAAATLSGSGRICSALADDGTVLSSGGMLALLGPVSGTGTLAIAPGATLFAASGVGAGLTACFLGDTGTLEIGGPGSGFAATIDGYAPGDVIELGGPALDAATWQPGELDLSAVATIDPVLSIAGDYTGQEFVVSSDGSGGTLVTLIACFAAGTRIATPDGEVPVERLRPGDRVRTPEGPRLLCWVAHRQVDARAAPEQRPVRITADAFGPGRPARDLLLSPAHAILAEGHLVPAACLVDGARVRREPTGRITYHHLGLPTHTLLRAEGLPVESFCPDSDAATFDLEAGTRPRPGPRCLPLLDSGAALETLRQRLLAHPGPLRGHVERVLPTEDGALIEGWAMDAAAPTRPVTLEVLRDGTRVACIIANLWRPDLDRAGLGDGRCAFRATLPGPPQGLTLRRESDGAVLPQAGAA